MSLHIIGLKPFVPSGPDFALARDFFRDLGFEQNWEADGLAELQLGEAVILLQDFHNDEMARNLMFQLVVPDLDRWWAHIEEKALVRRYPGVRAKPPQDYPWGLREIHLVDPAGVCWHLTQRAP